MMKTVGIIGAMEEELEYISQAVQVVAKKEIAGMLFSVGKAGDKGVVLVQSGIGKVNAAICTQILIDSFAVDEVISMGVAGAVSPELSLGDLVISSDAVEHDMDTTAFGDPVGIIPRMDESYFKADPELVAAAEAAAQALEMRYFLGRVGSGDQFVSSPKDKERIGRLVQATCVEMEGAAIAHACYLNHIPYVILRAISDMADGGAEVQYEDFMKDAARRAGLLIEEMLKRL